MLQNDKVIFFAGHFDKEKTNKKAWHFPAAICSKINTNPTSKNNLTGLWRTSERCQFTAKGHFCLMTCRTDREVFTGKNNEHLHPVQTGQF